MRGDPPPEVLEGPARGLRPGDMLTPALTSHLLSQPDHALVPGGNPEVPEGAQPGVKRAHGCGP